MPGAVGTLVAQGPWILGATVALLAVFFLVRGRVRIAKGWSGLSVARFTLLERLVHWTLALSFLVVAAAAFVVQLEGSPLAPLLSRVGLTEALRTGGSLHGAALLGFTAALCLAFLLWVRH